MGAAGKDPVVTAPTPKKATIKRDVKPYDWGTSGKSFLNSMFSQQWDGYFCSNDGKVEQDSAVIWQSNRLDTGSREELLMFLTQRFLELTT